MRSFVASHLVAGLLIAVSIAPNAAAEGAIFDRAWTGSGPINGAIEIYLDGDHVETIPVLEDIFDFVIKTESTCEGVFTTAGSMEVTGIVTGTGKVAGKPPSELWTASWNFLGLQWQGSWSVSNDAGVIRVDQGPSPGDFVANAATYNSLTLNGRAVVSTTNEDAIRDIIEATQLNEGVKELIHSIPDLTMTYSADGSGVGQNGHDLVTITSC